MAKEMRRGETERIVAEDLDDKSYSNTLIKKDYKLVRSLFEMVETIADKREIEKIIAEKIKRKNLVFTRHYRMRAAWRGISDEKVTLVFPQFEKIIAIEKKIPKKGDTGYELFYRLDEETTFSIATVPADKKIFIIHAIEYHRSLGRRFMQR